jgi:hypothetical protein
MALVSLAINLICKCLYVLGIELNVITVFEPVPVALAIDSYELVEAATPLDKLPRTVLSNSAYHIPSIGSSLNADCCFVLGK